MEEQDLSPTQPPRTRTVLDDKKKNEIIAILSVGCSRETAAQYVGCHPITIRRTALRDPKFAEQIAHAETAHEILHLKNINSAGKDGRYWRASAWALERGYPNRYAQRSAQYLTEEQVSQMLAQFAGIIVDEVPEPERRQRILERLDAVTAELQNATLQTTSDEESNTANPNDAITDDES